MKASVVESLHSKQEICAFYKSVGNSNTCTGSVLKSSSSRNFEKYPFNRSCTFTVSQSGFQFELLTKFLKGALILTDNFLKMISNEQ